MLLLHTNNKVPVANNSNINKIDKSKIDKSYQSLNMEIHSSAFINNLMIPSRFTCDGEDISPPIVFSNLPNNTKSLILIVDDPDAPNGTFTHWLLWNILPTTTEIDVGKIPAEAVEGTTSFGKPGYGGPCPPSGTHHYHFKLYSLDTLLNLKHGASRDELENAMKDHILSTAELVGIYTKK